MSSTTVTTSATPAISSETAIPSSEPDVTLPHELNPVLSFLIGFAIILGASIMNAGGLNLVKLDMVRTMALPRASRRRDFLRPLWVLGMVLYILSQLIGSTLALEYMRAEYVAPLGSSSLIFNFLFASLLVGTPVTRNDVYGTIIVVVGVIGIVLFGSINSGLENGMDLDRLISLWSRPGWLLYFILLQCFPLFLLFIGAAQLEAVLVARSDISAVPFAGQGGAGSRQRKRHSKGFMGFIQRSRDHWGTAMHWTREKIEAWSMNKNDKTLAWTLGICWACCGGGLAGECLVFAKACVKLISGQISHRNDGNQFTHPASIFTFIFLAITAVSQILCLNRGLRFYDSTLVVPVFYGVYTASGFLNSLIFNDEVDSYKSWTLFLIFLSISILIGGVVLLTLKKPEPAPGGNTQASNVSAPPARNRSRNKNVDKNNEDESNEEIALHSRPSVEREGVWELGNASDSDDDDREDPKKEVERTPRTTEPRNGYSGTDEHQGLVEGGDESDSDDFGEFATSNKRT